MLIQITPFLENLPHPRAICWEEISKKNYFFSGAARDGIVYCVFQHTVKGRGIFTANGTTYEMTPGKGFLCYIQDPAYTYHMPADATEPWEFIYIQMMGEPTRMMVDELVQRFGYVYELPSDRGSIYRYQNWIRDGHSVFSATAAMTVVTDLFSDLITSKELEHNTRHENHVIRNAMDVIDRNLGQSLTATQLAAELKISREYLSRLFRKHLRKSPYQYILEYKITHAGWRLQQSSDSIKEIACAFGFSSPELFCKAFRKIRGVPPSQYRKTVIA